MRQLYVVFIICLVMLVPALGEASRTPHPIQLFEQATGWLQDVDDNPDLMKKSVSIFADLIEEYPTSPLGYLGMSYVFRHIADLGNDKYDMRQLRDTAFPFAVQALRLGPTLPEVHENYAFFQRFFSIDLE